MRIRKLFRFEAAHHLPFHRGKCYQTHGHSYRLEVTVEGPLVAKGPESGMVMDFSALSLIVKQSVLDRLDHYSLNATLENPTCENVLAWISERLLSRLPGLKELVLWETDTGCAIMTFDAADS